jgi:hypothetical protein
MTPALLVPDTPEGRLYKALPAIFAQIANRAQEQAGRLNLISALNGWMVEGAAEHLHLLLLNQLADFEFSDAQSIGAAGMVRWLQQMPLFTWDDNAPQVEVQIWIDVSDKVQNFKLPIQQRAPGLYSVHPSIAYGYLGKMPNKLGQRGYMDEGGGACFAVYDTRFGVLFSQGFVNTTALALSTMVNLLQFNNDYQAIGRTAWVALPEFYTEIEDVTRYEFGVDTRPNFPTRQISPEYSEATLYPWPAIFANHPNVLVKPFAELGSKLNKARTRAERAELIQLAGVALAVFGGLAAIESIASQGAGFANVAKLIGSLDNLPGIDLGAVGDVAKGISGGINLANTIPGGVNMFEFEDVNLGDFNVGEFAGDIELTFEDIGVNVSPDFDFSIFDDYGLEAGDLLGDEFGNIFTVAGDAVTLSPEDYIKTIYVDESGNYRDFSNNVVLSQPEADYIFNESGADNDAVFEEIATRASMLSGNSFVSMEGSANRPAGTPSPAAQVQVPMFTQVSDALLSWVKTLTSYSLAKEQLEKTGRYTPPYATNPQGQSYSQVPGVPVRRADGSIVTNNGNGTQTVQFADGRVQTLPTNFSASGAMGGQLIAGVSNQTLLLAGAGVLAALLIARR